MKKFSYILLLMVSSLIGDQAKGEEFSGDLSALAMVEGMFAVAFMVTASNPKTWGNVMIAYSPIAAAAMKDEKHPWATYMLGFVVSAAYGKWLVDQEDEDESEIFKNQFLGINAILLPAWVYKKASGNNISKDSSHLFLNTDPINHDLILTYKVRF